MLHWIFAHNLQFIHKIQFTFECSSSGKCAHVLALIIIIESWKINEEILAKPSSSSLSKQWDKSRGTKVLPEPVSKIIISRPGNTNRKSQLWQNIVTTGTYKCHFFFIRKQSNWVHYTPLIINKKKRKSFNHSQKNTGRRWSYRLWHLICDSLWAHISVPLFHSQQ